MSGRLSAFSGDQSGTVAIVFCFSLIPIGLMVGAALDYSRASRVQTALSREADASALHAVSKTMLELSAKDAQAMALAEYRARAALVDEALTPTLDLKVVDNAKGRTATATFEANVPTTLMRLAGYQAVKVGGDAIAKSATPNYQDFYVLLDNSPSMGLGATSSDIGKMEAKTGCAFACHDMSQNGKDNYAVAKQIGMTMRIDVVRSATQQLMDNAASKRAVSNQFRAAVYTLGTACETARLTRISALSDDLSAVKSAAGTVDLMTIPYQNYNNDTCTSFDIAFPALNAEIATPGDGGTKATPQKTVFFVSDGVADQVDGSTCTRPTTGTRCQEPIKASLCQTLKSRGIRVAVLYTTYLPLPKDGWYNSWIKPFQPKLPSSMEACASPGLYFEVGIDEGISEAMNALFERAIGNPKLSN